MTEPIYSRESNNQYTFILTRFRNIIIMAQMIKVVKQYTPHFLLKIINILAFHVNVLHHYSLIYWIFPPIYATINTKYHGERYSL